MAFIHSVHCKERYDLYDMYVGCIVEACMGCGRGFLLMGSFALCALLVSLYACVVPGDQCVDGG